MRVASVVLIVLLACTVVAQEHQHGTVPGEKLGTTHFVTSCTPAVQPAFDRGIALLHSFDFPRAVAAFESVASADPACAMAYWGLALTRWGNPFLAGARPVAQLRQGGEAIARAKAAGTTTARERAYIDAAAHLYSSYETVPQLARMRAYRDAMHDVSARHPDDTEAAIFYALALAFSADPADKTYASQLKAGAILEGLFAQQPNHPGLAHYIIHGYDVPVLAARAVAAARRYATIAPSAPHALHMPSHTFTRVGFWQESIDANIAAAVAAKREGATAEELHASDYQTYAYLQTGQDGAVERLLKALPEIANRFDPAVVTAGAPPAAGFFALAAVPARYALERRAWAEAAALEPASTPVPYADAMSYFARALGAAHLRDIARARTAIDALRPLGDRLAQAGEIYWAEQVEIQRLGASAWLAFAEGRRDEALAGMRTAADREDATEKSVVTPGPLAPARELLGDLLWELKQPAAARSEYETALKKEPNRFRLLYGAARAADAAGDRAGARRYYQQLIALGARADRPRRAELLEARRALGQRP